jgi:hypothetical protein
MKVLHLIGLPASDGGNSFLTVQVATFFVS